MISKKALSKKNSSSLSSFLYFCKVHLHLRVKRPLESVYLLTFTQCKYKYIRIILYYIVFYSILCFYVILALKFTANHFFLKPFFNTALSKLG